MPIHNRFAELHADITEWRQDFHRHPELQFDVTRTASVVAEKLRAFGCDEVVEGVGRSGVVGVIHGKQTSSGRVIGLRADMDALPIHEITGAKHASTVPGVMHACGHDGHTAMLLGAARYLAETRNFNGTAIMIFQPAEEGGGGALEMCRDGLMDRWNIHEVYGIHNMPGMEPGQFGIRPGALFAAADQFTITVTGSGGHAARPQDTVDPTLVASHLVVALQSIVSRNSDPLASIVVSVTSFRTESNAYNVIPQQVELRGTVRTLDESLRDTAEARVRALAEHTSAAFGATAELRYDRGYPVMSNHVDETQYAAEVAHKISGRAVLDVAPLMAAEDFSYMLQERPGAYILLGNGDSATLHHPAYEFNDDAIPAGCSWLAGMIEARMPAA